jgi:N-acetylglucosaminyl-diphospho-decaprenol L-rhamnosyltransferase
MPKLSVVIVNYNTRALTLACLQSVYQAAARGQLDSDMECILVDNASRDDSLAAIGANFPQVRLIANRVNNYFSAGYAQGVAAAIGDYIVVLNADMVVRGNALGQLLAAVAANAEIGAATTSMYFADDTLQHNCADFPTLWDTILDYSLLGKLLAKHKAARRARLWYANWDRCSSRTVDILPGSCIMAPRAIWKQTGGFDARMLMYFSDDYFCRQVQALGKSTFYIVSDGITHYEGASKNHSTWSIGVYMRDLLVYARLVYGRGGQWLLALLIWPTWLAQWLKAKQQASQRARQPTATLPPPV